MGKSSNVFRVPMPNIQVIDCPPSPADFGSLRYSDESCEGLMIFCESLSLCCKFPLVKDSSFERSWTSDLRMSTYVTKSPPLFQLRYRKVKSCITLSILLENVHILFRKCENRQMSSESQCQTFRTLTAPPSPADFGSLRYSDESC